MSFSCSMMRFELRQSFKCEVEISHKLTPHIEHKFQTWNTAKASGYLFEMQMLVMRNAVSLFSYRRFKSYIMLWGRRVILFVTTISTAPNYYNKP